MEEETEEKPEECGGVWQVNAVHEKTRRKGPIEDFLMYGCRNLNRTPKLGNPMKIDVSERYRVFEVDEESDEEDEIFGVDEEIICGICEDAEEVNEVVEVTVDSGAGRSVWPRKKKGVTRRKCKGATPKLVAANATEIKVHGEATLEFEMGGPKVWDELSRLGREETFGGGQCDERRG